MPNVPIGEIIPALAAIADEVILPRYQALHDAEVEEKAPGELVTVADREAEVRITEVLRALRPDAIVIGEEAVAGRPALLAALETDAACWLVDPLDGTRNFVDGNRAFAVMVALVEAGETVASWIWCPLDRIAYVAERGSGAYRNGVRQRIPPAPPVLDELRGAVLATFLSPGQRDALVTIAPRFREIGRGQHCAGIEYPLIASGAQEFARFQRLLPWDHAPGTLYLEEAGGCVRRWDGTPYAPGTDGTGLLAASDEATWALVRNALGPAIDRPSYAHP